MRKVLLTFLCVVGASVFVSCGSTSIVETANTPTDYPSTPPAFTGLPAKRPVTKVLTQFAADGVTEYQKNGNITYIATRSTPLRQKDELGTMKTDQLQQVAVGTILVSPPTLAAPYGFLRKVTDVIQNTDGTFTIETDEATLQEAIAGSDLKKNDLKTTTFKIPVDVVMSPKENRVLQPYSSSTKVKPRWEIPIAQLPDSLCKPYERPIFNNAKVNFTPCVKARIWATVDVNIGWWWIFPYLSGFGAKLNGYASAGLNANVNALSVASNIGLEIPIDISANFNIVSWLAPPFTVWLGPIPIVLTTQIDLGVDLGKITLSAQASATASITSSLSNFNFSLGSDTLPLEYGFYCGNTLNAGQWGCNGINNIPEKFNALTDQIRNWNPLSNPVIFNSGVSFNFGISYSAKARLSGAIALYGVLGMVGSIEPYINPNINVNVSPYPKGVKVGLSAGATVGVSGYLDGFVNLVFLQQRFNIASFPNIVPQTQINFLNHCWDNAAPVPCG
jgi:hypothetical protein